MKGLFGSPPGILWTLPFASVATSAALGTPDTYITALFSSFVVKEPTGGEFRVYRASIRLS